MPWSKHELQRRHSQESSFLAAAKLPAARLPAAAAQPANFAWVQWPDARRQECAPLWSRALGNAPARMGRRQPRQRAGQRKRLASSQSDARNSAPERSGLSAQGDRLSLSARPRSPGSSRCLPSRGSGRCGPSPHIARTTQTSGPMVTWTFVPTSTVVSAGGFVFLTTYPV